MIRPRYTVLLLLLALRIPCGDLAGQETRPVPEGFRQERLIKPGGAGANRLPLDAELLSGSAAEWRFGARKTDGDGKPEIFAAGGMTDLRIYDWSNREIPYLLIEPPEPEWVRGRLAPLAATKKTSGFRLDLGRPMRLDRVRFDGVRAPYVKRCTLEASRDGVRWVELIRGATVYDLPIESMKLVEIGFEQGDYRHLRVTWDDGATPRVGMPRAAEARAVSAGAVPPRLQAPLAYERRGSEPGVSRFRIRLPGPHLPLTEIRLETGGGHVLRKARIVEARLSGSEIVPEVLGAATLRREVRRGIAAERLAIDIEPPREAQVDLVIEDGNNPPLEIAGITAVFARLPWIYFETVDDKPLLARYGYPGLGEPRYDLEAARESAGKAKTLEARWEEKLPEKAGIARPQKQDSFGPGSEMDPGGFRYERVLSTGKRGLQVLPLDAAALAHSRVADLRIAGKDGRQVPYLVEKPDEPLSIDLRPPERTGAPRSAAGDPGRGAASRSYYRLRLPCANLPAARLVLSTSARVFRRNLSVRIEKDADGDSREPWTRSVASAYWSHSDPDTPAPALTLRLGSLDTADLMLVVEEGDNSPIPIESARLLLPAVRLRFFGGGTTGLKLYYGHDDLEAPNYDLAILGPHLVGAKAEEARLGPEMTRAPSGTGQATTRLFWVVLIAAVAVLLLLIARLVGKSKAG